MSVTDEREGGENTQWRRPCRADDWEGVWGRQSLPRVRERKRKLPQPPCKGELREVTMTNESRSGLPLRPTRAGTRGGERKRKPPVPPSQLC